MKKYNKKADSTYRAMFRRCKEREAYNDCFVCDEWTNDKKAFFAWFEENYVEGYDLDKDILIPNNKVYSPDTCMFVPRRINQCFKTRSRKWAALPAGVCIERLDLPNPYKASIRINGKLKALGLFSTPTEAHIAWQYGKIEQLTIMIGLYPEFGDSIQMRIDMIKDDINMGEETIL